VFTRLIHIILYCLLIFFSVSLSAQVCPKDSNFYLITYKGTEYNTIDKAIVTTENEIIALGQFGTYRSFIAKFTGLGTNIWSNEYKPDYPHTSWVQFPWYENTSMQGLLPAANGSFIVYGSSFEHGKSINNVEEPPGHWVGMLIHIDKFGNTISGKYFGNWRTGYAVNNVIATDNGNLIVYLRSLTDPSISKILCVDNFGGIIWGAPLQTVPLYNEVGNLSHAMTRLKNGNIVVAREMVRNIADTIFYPFQPPIILPAPLNYFHLFELDGKTGNLLWETSYQCPTLTNTNISNPFTPEIKNIIQLPNGNLSLLADMYLPVDNERFYAHKLYSRRAVNFIADKDGFLQKLIAYRPENTAGSLESMQQIANSTERLLTIKDSTNENILVFKINNDGQIIWKNSYKNVTPTNTSKIITLEKNGGKGLFTFQSDENSFNFHSSVTNAVGNNPCAPSNINVIAENVLWTWLVEKVHLFTIPVNIDFRYSAFNIKSSIYPISQNTDCEYQFACCKDFIDTVNIKNISLCPGEIYTLPDNNKVKDSGNYYATLKGQKGCDSILLYNVKLLKLPADLKTTPDTCLNNATTIELRATEGYNTYLWNNVTSQQSFYPVSLPGNYTVKVENKCGSKTDSIIVYSNCDFPVYFPNAFTPNKDFINDILKVPRQNKNRLKKLSIYNRYGQVIFQTTKFTEGWDGNYRGMPQSAGVYIYFLEMEGLSGKKINQKGSVVLIR
jgi:gliding motility-associated-like protein